MARILSNNYIVTKLAFKYNLGIMNTIPESSLNTWGFSSVKFPVQYMMALRDVLDTEKFGLLIYVQHGR
jgi:hypothetical protein